VRELILVFGRRSKLEAHTKGGRDGTAGYSYRYDAWPSRPAPASQRQWRRHVADHDGAVGAACLQGIEGQERPSGSSRRHEPTGTITAGQHYECRQPGGALDDILGGLFGGKPGSAPGRATAQPGGGSLSEIFPGGLGSVLGGAAAGSVLSGGLGNLIKELQDAGHGQVARSWVGTGPNEEIAPKDLANALGGDALNTLSKQSGLSRDELLAGLSQHLPDLVDQLTPKGRVPTEEEAARLV
jgi:uncharacterized protein YidB (DUF937 family)